MKKKTPKTVRTPKATNWDKVKTFPVKLFHTFRGPIMGLVDPSVGKNVRLWAPAMVMRNPQNVAMVVYIPLDFVENYVELSPITMVGSSPAPDVIVEGYQGFVNEFTVGSYNMKPVAIGAGVEMPKSAETAVKNASGDAPAEPSTEPVIDQSMVPCPGCNQEVSNWRAHYPVQVAVDVVPELPGPPRKWICEIGHPDIREQYPDYEPPTPEPRASSLH